MCMGGQGESLLQAGRGTGQNTSDGARYCRALEVCISDELVSGINGLLKRLRRLGELLRSHSFERGEACWGASAAAGAPKINRLR